MWEKKAVTIIVGMCCPTALKCSTRVSVVVDAAQSGGSSMSRSAPIPLQYSAKAAAFGVAQELSAAMTHGAPAALLDDDPDQFGNLLVGQH